MNRGPLTLFLTIFPSFCEQMEYTIEFVLKITFQKYMLCECERDFSVMKYIKDEKRASLKLETLESQLRCKINGPNDERYFKADYYARAWLNENHMRTEDPAQQRKSNNLD
jgi:hypothetical protein